MYDVAVGRGDPGLTRRSTACRPTGSALRGALPLLEVRHAAHFASARAPTRPDPIKCQGRCDPEVSMCRNHVVPLALRIVMAGLMSAPRGLRRPSGRRRPAALERLRTPAARASAAPWPGAVAAHPGKTGVSALLSGRDAFAARMMLARAAERTLDVQYYIWHDDMTGTLLFEALWHAAERGVRVRLLLDDNNTRGLDDDARRAGRAPEHRGAAVQPVRQPRAFASATSLTDFARLNRRMHNKSFTADNQVDDRRRPQRRRRILRRRHPGRRSPTSTCSPSGRWCATSRAQFDAYWNSASAYPAASRHRRVARCDGGASCERLAELDARARRPRVYLDAVRGTPLVRQLLAGDAAARMGRRARGAATIRPRCCSRPSGRDLHMLPRLKASWASRSASSTSSRPTSCRREEGTEALIALAARGVKVRVLTNSLAATDVAPVHAGYVEVPRGAAARRRAAVRAQARAAASRRSATGAARRQLRRQPARQDLRGRPQPHLRRLVQLRSALGAAQHRDGRRDRQPGARDAAVGGVRPQHPAPRLRSAPVGRRRAASNGSSRHRRAKCATRRPLEPALGGRSTSTCFGSCRSSGCCSEARRPS